MKAKDLLQSQIDELQADIETLEWEPVPSAIQASNDLLLLDSKRKELQELEEQLDELL